MKKIFDYLDYRDYLYGFHKMMKLENFLFSYRLFDRMVDMDQGYLANALPY